VSAKKINWFDLSKLNLTLPNLAPEFDGFEIVQISDIHFGTFIKRRRLEEVVRAVNDLDPDLIVFTGDLVSDDPERHAPILVDNLKNLNARYGVVAVRGNHDHWTDSEYVSRIFERAGVIHLDNSVLTIKRDGAALYIAGLDCHYVGKDRLDLILGMISPVGAAILLVHEPDFADISAKAERFDLQISGHSHGGQLSLPWYGPIWLPRFGRKYPSGLYKQDGMLHYTNRGIGTSHLKVRVNCPPELTLFKIFSPQN
jgi:predicted MPP superfamily phosphohydrolase